jgi:predicted dehydrogenase
MFLSQVSRPQRGWMYDRARAGGGVVANLSSHLLFVLRACFGMPTRVGAVWRHVHSSVEDELRATMEMPGCPAVEFETSWCVPGHPVSRTTLAVEGPNGTLRVDNDAVELDLREPRHGLDAGHTTIPEAELPQPARFSLNGEAYTLEDAHFLRWVTGGPAPTITAAAGLEVQRIMEALYTSAASGGAPTAVPAEDAPRPRSPGSRRRV